MTDHTPEVRARMSEAQRATWLNPEVRARRSERIAVRVGGALYKSTAEAFRALGLDMKAHARVRAEVRGTGSAEHAGVRFERASPAASAEA